MRKYLWVVEQEHNNKWYPLVNYIRRCREDARRMKIDLDNYAMVNRFKCKYRVSKYERSRLGDYWSDVFGFDICKFDDDVNCPDGISLEDFLTMKYGKEASELISNLIKWRNYAKLV